MEDLYLAQEPVSRAVGDCPVVPFAAGVGLQRSPDQVVRALDLLEPAGSAAEVPAPGVGDDLPVPGAVGHAVGAHAEPLGLQSGRDVPFVFRLAGVLGAEGAVPAVPALAALGQELLDAAVECEPVGPRHAP